MGVMNNASISLPDVRAQLAKERESGADGVQNKRRSDAKQKQKATSDVKQLALEFRYFCFHGLKQFNPTAENNFRLQNRQNGVTMRQTAGALAPAARAICTPQFSPAPHCRCQ
jgi:hypothetical protein